MELPRHPIMRWIAITLVGAIISTAISVAFGVYYGKMLSPDHRQSSAECHLCDPTWQIHRTDGYSEDEPSFQITNTLDVQLHLNITGSQLTQEQRQAQMRTVCRNYYQTKPIDLNENPAKALHRLDKRFHHTYFNDDFKLMVSYIHKIGSSNWLRIFQNLHKKSSRKFQTLQRDPLWTLKSSENFPKSEKQLIGRLLNFTKIVFVRNPLSRLLSAYKDKFVNLPTPYYRQKARQIIGFERGIYRQRKIPDVTFSEFIQFITNDKLGLLIDDDHWNPIVDNYHPCDYYFDFIGHLETVYQDTNYLFKYLQIDEIVRFDASRNPTDSSNELLLQKYFSPLSDTLFRKVVSKYEDDFRVFGYRIPQNSSDL